MSNVDHDVETRPGNGLAVAALVVGIVSLLGVLLAFGGLLGLVGIALGVAALVRVRKRGARGSALAVTGIVLSTLALLASVLLIVFLSTLLDSAAVQDYQDCITRGDDVGLCQDALTTGLEDELLG